MDRPIAAKYIHRLASYALVAALSLGPAIGSSVAEARAPEDRPKVAANSAPAEQGLQRVISQFNAAIDDRAEAETSLIQSLLAGVYDNLLGLKAAIGSALDHAWKWGHSKSGKTCS